MTGPDRIIVGISGASGAAIGIRIVELLAQTQSREIHVVVTPAGERTLAQEAGPQALAQLGQLARRHACGDIGACIASGSFRTLGMIVAPCSIKTLSAIAGGYLDNLLVRAADVQLKERRRLVLLVRETPLHLGHLRAMAQVTEFGAIVAPPVPAFYLKPASISEIVDQIARRAVALVDATGRLGAAREWDGLANPP